MRRVKLFLLAAALGITVLSFANAQNFRVIKTGYYTYGDHGYDRPYYSSYYQPYYYGSYYRPYYNSDQQYDHHGYW